MDTLQSHRKTGQHTTLSVGAVAILAILAWWQWGGLVSSRDSLVYATEQLEQMRSDAVHIQKLREAPRAAVSRARTNEELLAQIERALSAAGIDRNRWQDSIPQPPVRETGSPYVRHITRIYLEGVELKQLASFVHCLEADDATLEVASVNLASRSASSGYDAELGVMYLVFSARKNGEN